MRVKKLLSAVIALVMACVALPTLSACSGAVSASDLVVGWPSDVPVIKGTVVQTGLFGEGEDSSFEVVISVSDFEEALTQLQNQMSSSGFDTVSELDSDRNFIGNYSSPDWNVAVVISSTGSAATATYEVTRSR